MRFSLEQVPHIRILGVRVHMVQIPEVVAVMSHWLSDERQKCHHVVNTGMHGIMQGRKDKDFKAILNSADLFFPDGIAVILIGRCRGFRIKKKGIGPELLREFCKVSANNGYKNFFYGDTADTLETLVTNLRKEFPDLQVAGKYSPPFRPLSREEDDEVVQMINEAQPDVLWVGLGCPKQERWIYEHKDKLNVPVAIGVGAYFKFFSGGVRRAPSWVGNLGFEWLWRLLHEPRRVWRRVMFDGPWFIALALLELSGLKRYD